MSEAPLLVQHLAPRLLQKEREGEGNVKRFRRGLVFKAHKLAYHSTPGWRVKNKKRGGVDLLPDEHLVVVGAQPKPQTLFNSRTGPDGEGHARCRGTGRGGRHQGPEREFFIDNLLVQIHFIIVMVRWTGLAPWEFEFPFPGSLTSTFLGPQTQRVLIAGNA